jgi:type I restriction enzyme S subunit
MEVKPGYKKSEVGVIPKDWSVVRIGAVAKVQGGYAFSSRKFVPQGKYQVVKTSNLYGGTFDLERSASFLNKLDDQEKYYLLKKDNILITLTGTIGKRDYGYSHRIVEERNLLLNQRVARLVVHDTTNASYVAFQIKMPCFLDQFFEAAKGGTGNQANVGTTDLQSIHISLPQLPEQASIADALHDVSDLIATLDRLVAKKRDIKQAAMQQLLTAQTRLPGFHGEWDLASLNQIVIRSTGVWGRGERDETHRRLVEIIRAGDISQDGKLTATASRFVSDAEFAKAKCELDNLVITTSGNGLGKVWWCDGRVDIAATNFVRVLRPKKGKAIGKYLSYVLRTAEGLRLLQEHTATSAYPNLRPTFFSATWIPLPEIPEQTAIAEALTDIDAEVAALEQRREKTRALKQAMMQELLTGKTRLL